MTTHGANRSGVARVGGGGGERGGGLLFFVCFCFFPVCDGDVVVVAGREGGGSDCLSLLAVGCDELLAV